MDKIFLAMYNPMIYESSFGVLSVHKTEKGAQMAIDFHKEEERKDWIKLYPNEEDQKNFPFAQFKRWEVMCTDLLD